ncbi:unnamed protein product [Urochloa humidicola]
MAAAALPASSPPTSSRRSRRGRGRRPALFLADARAPQEDLPQPQRRELPQESRVKRFWRRFCFEISE